MSKNKVPEICFNGFSKELVETRLGDICTIGDIDHRMPKSVLEGIPYLMTGDFIDNNGLDFKNCKFISIEDYEQLSRKIKPEVNDILFARYASVGDVRYVETDIKFLISYSCAIIKCNKDIVGRFLFYYLQSNRIQYQIEININTGSQRNIGIDSLKKLTIFIPKIEEQERIGNYFQQLDKLIEQKEKKYQKLKQFKKAMLDKMFPKNGADTPEIRFKGFSGKWKEKRLEEIALIKTGYPFDSNKFDANGEYLVITNGNIQNDFSFVDNLLGNKINIEDKCSLTEYILNLNDILVTMDGTVGRVAKVIHEKQILAQRVGRIISLINSDFVYYFLSTGDFFKKMKLISTGGTIKHISLNDISKYESYIPKDFEEQKKIGDYFQKLDNQIELQQKELEKLKNIKKASLAKMFV